jgi:glycosyltransferase involved in cell wall biosynthesis
MFSIIIPTFNNLEYLKICLRSLEKNSKFKNEIIIHVNEGIDGSLEHVKQNKLIHTHTTNNVGLCTAVNLASSKATTEYIIFSHDDMYYCPGWDEALFNEIKKLNTKAFFLSGTMIEKNSGHLQLDCGNNYNDFNETKLLNNFKKLQHVDHQGTHWPPSCVHKTYWEKIGGFGEEFNPGIGCDPDLNMKLWKAGVRIFKGLSNLRVYHFASIVLRKKKNFKRNNGAKTFLIKWGISIRFFIKFYLRGPRLVDGKIESNKYDGPLTEPKKSIEYFSNLFICKLKLLYVILVNPFIKLKLK